MTNRQFLEELERSYLRSKDLLIIKGEEYSIGGDRLGQFYRAGNLQNTSPTEALMGMAVKHVISIVDMCKNPSDYTINLWHEKVTDLRNYTFLLDALLVDMEAKNTQGG